MPLKLNQGRAEYFNLISCGVNFFLLLGKALTIWGGTKEKEKIPCKELDDPPRCQKCEYSGKF